MKCKLPIIIPHQDFYTRTWWYLPENRQQESENFQNAMSQELHKMPRKQAKMDKYMNQKITWKQKQRIDKLLKNRIK
jgi:hypothetical protein